MDIKNLEYEFNRTEAQIKQLTIDNHSSAANSNEELERLKAKEETLIERAASIMHDWSFSD